MRRQIGQSLRYLQVVERLTPEQTRTHRLNKPSKLGEKNAEIRFLKGIPTGRSHTRSFRAVAPIRKSGASAHQFWRQTTDRLDGCPDRSWSHLDPRCEWAHRYKGPPARRFTNQGEYRHYDRDTDAIRWAQRPCRSRGSWSHGGDDLHGCPFPRNQALVSDALISVKCSAIRSGWPSAGR